MCFLSLLMQFFDFLMRIRKDLLEFIEFYHLLLIFGKKNRRNLLVIQKYLIT
jgi:hypothetical protein